MARKLLLLFLLLNFTTCVWATDYTSDANCQGAWLFETGSGETAVDSSQNSNDGTFLSADHPEWSSTVPDTYSTYSVWRPDDDTQINMGADTVFPATSDFTYMLWLRTDADGINRVVINRTTATNELLIVYLNNDDTVSCWIRDDDGAGLIQEKSASTLSADDWVHVAFVRDESANQVEIFWNGSSDATPADADWGQISPKLRFFEDETSGFAFPGYLDEVGYFDRLLTSTEINDIMDNGLEGAVVARRIFIVGCLQ
jgi:hypothetical protein